MEYDRDKVDDMVLALMYITSSTDRFGTRAWKGIDIQVLDRLQAKGYLGDPREKTPTVVVTKDGAERSRELFRQYFAVQEEDEK